MKVIECEINKSTFRLGTIFVVIFIALITVVAYDQRDMFINFQKEKLQILANEKSNQINSFLESQKQKFLLIASMDEFRNAALYPNDPTKIEIAKKKLNDLKNIVPDIGILTTKGIIVVSKDNPAGTDYSDLPQFPIKDKLDVTFLSYYDKQRNKYYYAIGGPIYDSADKNKIVGVITYDINIDEISSLLQKMTSNNNELLAVQNRPSIKMRFQYKHRMSAQ